MSKAQRRREAAIRKIQQAAGVDRDLAEHMLDKQIEPQLHAVAMRAEGDDVRTAIVSTRPDAPGVEVSCHHCGRMARMPSAPPAGKVVLCPDCLRRHRNNMSGVMRD